MLSSEFYGRTGYQPTAEEWDGAQSAILPQIKKDKVMKDKELFAAVYGIAELNRDGFTFNIDDRKIQATGYAVARKETQNSFGETGLQNCISFALANNVQCIGGWYDNESGKYYFDATEIFSNKDAAIEAGRRNDQIAIFDINALKEIRL